MRHIEQFRVDHVAVLAGRRPINPDAVGTLASSIAAIGLQTPITVRIVEEFVDSDGVVVGGQPVLVTGAHRLAAVKSLGWEKVDAYVMDDDASEIDAEMWEISENLHRAELSTLERSEQVARWVKLAEERALQLAQVAPIETKRADGRGHRLQSGVRAASRDLGLDRDAVRRAVKISSISEQAKQAAIEAGIADNQSALLAVARAQDQLAEVQRQVEVRVTHRASEDREWEALIAVWNRASDQVQRRFVAWIHAQ